MSGMKTLKHVLLMTNVMRRLMLHQIIAVTTRIDMIMLTSMQKESNGIINQFQQMIRCITK